MDPTKSISVIHRRAKAFYVQALSKVGVSYGQMPVILLICEKPGLSQQELSDEFEVDKSVIAKSVKQLMDLGYVNRQFDPNSRKIYNLYPTKKAQEVYGKVSAIRDEWNRRMVEGLTDVEQVVFLKLLDKVYYSLEDS